jgi:octaprenyl-diphosphate synthase
MLVLLVAKCMGKVTERVFAAASAMELLHSASLLHDDVIDESDMRRGRPSLNVAFNNNIAVLTGDYLFSQALNNAAKTGDIRTIEELAKLGKELSSGEVMQVELEKEGTYSEENYYKVIYNKTASLFEAACVSAALSVNASDEMTAAAKDYAVALGLAFQIKDDILDYSGTVSVGKPLGVDILEQKITMPLLGALAEAPSEQAAKIRDMVKEIPGHPEYRDEILTFVTSGGGVEYAKKRLDEYVAKAMAALDVFPDSYEKSCLAELARYTAIRNR